MTNNDCSYTEEKRYGVVLIRTVSVRLYQANTRRRNNVVSTLLRRHNFEKTFYDVV